MEFEGQPTRALSFKEKPLRATGAAFYLPQEFSIG